MSANNRIDPAAGNWYQDLADGELFQVVSMDEAEAMVELQYLNGDIGEVSVEEWRSLDLEAADPPEDWTGPIDDVEPDNLGFSEERSEGERRGLAQEQRSSDLQDSEVSGGAGTLSERRPADEQRESEVIEGTERKARDEQHRGRGDVE